MLLSPLTPQGHRPYYCLPIRHHTLNRTMHVQTYPPTSPCENFLYVFKAARRAAHAADTAPRPSLSLARRSGRGQRQSAGAKNVKCRAVVDVQQLQSVQPRDVHAPAAGLSVAGQNPSRAPTASAPPIFDS